MDVFFKREEAEHSHNLNRAKANSNGAHNSMSSCLGFTRGFLHSSAVPSAAAHTVTCSYGWLCSTALLESSCSTGISKLLGFLADLGHFTIASPRPSLFRASSPATQCKASAALHALHTFTTARFSCQHKVRLWPCLEHILCADSQEVLSRRFHLSGAGFFLSITNFSASAN